MTLGSATEVAATIEDNDAAPSGITLTASPDTVAEDVASAPTVTVRAAVNGSTRYPSDKRVTVAVGKSSDSAKEGTDYATVSDLTITIKAGTASADGTFTLTPTDDDLAEGSETISVAGSSDVTVTGDEITLTDDEELPTAALVLTPATITEDGGTSTVTATLTGASSEAVTLTVAAQAVTPAVADDFTLSAAKTLTIAAGATSSTGAVTITAVDNAVDAADKKVKVSATASGGHGVAAPAAKTLTLSDDDAEPTGITLSVNPTQVTENVPTAPTVTVTAAVNGTTRYVDEKTVAVAVGASADTATEGTDYATVGALSIAIAAGAASGTTSFTLDPTEDDLDEGDEAISVSGTTPGVTVSGTQLTIGDALELSAPANQVYTRGRKITDLALPAATGGTGAKSYTLVGPEAAAVRTVLPGLSYTAASRTLSGTPSAAKAATTLTYTVTDANEVSDSITFKVTVVEPPTLADPADRTYVPTQTVSDVLPAAVGGATPLTYTLVGPEAAAVGTVLPGLGFTAGSRTLGGTAGAEKAAVTLTYTVADKNGASATQTFTVTTAKQVLVLSPTAMGRVYGATDPAQWEYTVAAKTGSTFAPGDSATSTFFSSSPLQRASGDDVGQYAFSLVSSPQYATGMAAKYTFEVKAGAAYTITKKALSIVTPVVLTKVYDGDTDAAGASIKSGGAVTGEVGAESFALTVTGGTYPQSDVGSNLTIASPSFTLTPGNAASKTSNYEYTLPDAATGEITAKEVTVAPAVLSKVYDGGTGITNAKLSGGAVSGAVGAESLTLKVTGGSYASADVGTTITISNPAFALKAGAGTDKDNYRLPSSISLSGTITAKAITEVAGVTVVTRPVDGTIDAEFDTTRATGAGVVSGELAGFRGGLQVSGTFPERAKTTVGTYDVEVSYTLGSSGAFKATNYTLGEDGDTLRGTVSDALALRAPADQVYTRGTAIADLPLPAATGGTGEKSYTLVGPDDAAVGTVLPDLSFDAASRTLSGTPSAAKAATTLTYTVTDATKVSASVTFTVQVVEPPALGDPDDRTYTVSQTVSDALPAAVGGASPLTYTLLPATGTLAEALPGMSFTAADHTLGGSPTTATAQAVTLTYRVEDDNGAAAEQTFTVTVNAAPALSAPADQVYVKGTAIDDLQLPAATGGTGDKSYTLVGPQAATVDQALPGLSFDAASRTLSGTPSEVKAATTLTYTATDENGVSATASFKVTVVPAGVLALAITEASVAEAPGAAFALTVTLKDSDDEDLTLSADLAVKVTPKFTAGTGKAVAADLSDSTAKTLTISTGSSSASASFGIEDDALDEPDEALAFKLTADSLPTGVTLGSATEVAATIEDNDAAPTGITLTVSPDTVAEDVQTAPAVTVTAAVNGSTRYVGAKRVAVAVGASADTATEGTDYAAVGDLSIDIAAGAASGTATFTLNPTDDAVSEGDETISVSGTATGLTVTPATLTISDDEALPEAALVLTPDEITENGGTSTVTARLTGGTSSAAVTLTVAAVAVTPAVTGDFTLSTAKTLTIAAGATSSTGTVTITAVDNDVDAAAKEVTVSAAASGGHGVAAPANRTLTITDDDPTLVTGGDVSVGEGDGSATLTLSVTRVSGDTSVVQGTVTPKAGTAGSGDYTAGAVSFTIAADKSSAEVAIPITDDTVIEGDEQFTAAIVVSSPNDGTFAGGTAPTITITDDDQGVLALAITDASVAEAQDAAFALTVTLKNSGGTALTLPEDLAVKVTPKFTAGAGKAAAADLSDNTAKTVTISTGSSSAAVSFGIVDDALDEPDEALAFKLTADTLPAGVALGSAIEAAATIEDNDATVVTAGNVSVGEGDGSATLTLSVTRVSGDTSVVQGTVTPTAGTAGSADYTAGAVSFTIAADKSSASVEIPITDDSVIEGSEQFTAVITVSSPNDGTFAGGTAPTVTITDDDTGVLALAIADASVAEAQDVAFALTVTLKNGEGDDLTLPENLAVKVTPKFTTGTGKAAAADLSTSTAKTLTITTGSSSAAASFGIVDDALDEPDESLAFKISADNLPAGVTLGSATEVAATIEDNDATVVTAGNVSVGEGDGSATLTLNVTRVSGDTSVVTGTVTPTPGTAGSGDYTAGAVSFTIAADKSSAEAAIPITDDRVIEGNEQFTAAIAVTSPNDGTFAAGTAPTVTITDDDTGLLALAIGDADVAEAQGAAFALTVTLQNSSGEDLTLPNDLAVKVAPKFTAGTSKAVAADLSTSTAKTVTITKGSSSAAASFGIVDDALDEPDEALAFKLSADNLPAGVTLGSATDVAATIEDNDATVVTGANVSVGEGDGSATLTLSVTRVSGDTSVVKGTVTPKEGTAGSADYSAGAVSFTIAADKSSAEVAIPITDDRVIEGSEQFTAVIAVTSPSDGTFAASTAPTVTITDDDQGMLALAITDASVAEAQDAAFALTVTLKNSEGDDLTLPENLAVKVTPKFTTGTGKAAAADLSDSTAKTLTITAGSSSAAASFGIEDDALDEPDEALAFKLTADNLPSGVTLGSATEVAATIEDNDATVVTASNVSVGEGDGNATLTLSVTRVSGDTSVVQGTVTPKAGTAGSADYTAGAVSFTIAADKSSAEVAIPITDDRVIEGDEQFTAVIAVSSPNDGTFAGGTAPTVIITDDDTGVLALAISDASVAESSSADFELTVTLKNSEGEDLTLPENLAVKVTPKFTTGTGKAAAADLSDSTAKTLTITAGSSSAAASFGIVDDTLDEPDEALAFKLTADNLPSGVTLGSATEVAATIEDNDATVVTGANVSVGEGDGNATLTLSVTRVSGDTSVVQGTVTPTTGTAGSADYTATAVSFTIASTKSSASVAIPITDDSVIEGSEQFTAVIAVTSPSDGTFAAGTAPTVTITDNDTGVLALAIGDASVAEAQDAAFALTVTLKNSDGDDLTLPADLAVKVTPKFTTGTGKAAAADLSTSTAKTLTITTGSSSAAASFGIEDDALDEPDESLAFKLTADNLPTGVTLGSATDVAATIEDNDATVVTASNVSVGEGDGTATLTLSVTRVSGDTSVVTGTVTPTPGTAGSGDYTAGAVSFTIAADKSSAEVAIPITDDRVVEGSEQFTAVIAVSSPSDGTFAGGTAPTITITDNDTGVLALAISDASVAEAQDAAFALTVTLKNSGGTALTLPEDLAVKVTPKFTAGDGKAAAADLSTSTAKTLTISAGASSATASFGIVDDALDEPDETLAFKLTADTLPTGVTLGSTTEVAATIEDDDPTVVTGGDVSVGEGDGSATLTLSVTRVSGDTSEVKGTVTPKAGTAVSADYTAGAVSFTIAADKSSAEVAIPITDDRVIEGDEQFTAAIAVSSPNDGTFAGGTAPTVTITDDDQGVLALAISDASVAEAQDSAFALTVTLKNSSGDDLTLPEDLAVKVTPKFTTGTGKAVAADLSTSTAKTLTITTGSSSAAASFGIEDDALDEPDEALTFKLTADNLPSGVTLGSATEVAATIEDNDATVVTGGDVSVGEGDGSATLTLSVARVSGDTSVVQGTVTPKAGTAGSADYTAGAVSFTIAADKSSAGVEIPITDDSVIEGTEQFTAAIAVSNPSDGTFAPGTAPTVTITDNDTGVLALAISDASVEEAPSAAFALTVTLKNSSGEDLTLPENLAVEVTPKFTTGTGKAVAADLSDNTAKTLTITTGSSSVAASFGIEDDALDEPDEALAFKLTADTLPTGVTLGSTTEVAATIEDNDGAPSGITLTVNPDTVAENVQTAPAVTVTAAVNGSTRYVGAKRVTVAVGASADTATEGTDYATVSDLRIDIAAGAASGTATFTLDPTDDAVSEGDEAISVTGTSDVTVTPATLTISDDEALPEAALVLTPDEIAEDGGTSTVTARLTGGTSSAAVTLTVAAQAVTPAVAGDFTLSAARTLTIAAGATSSTGTVTITAVDNAVDAAAKTVTVSAQASGGHGVAAPTNRTLTITDDDPTLVTGGNVSVGEGAGNATLTLNVTRVTGDTSEVQGTVTPKAGTAVSADYTATAVSFTIASTKSSASVEIPITDDRVIEGSEQFTAVIAVSSPNDGTFAGGTAPTITITDDDQGVLALAITAASVAEAQGAAFALTVTLKNSGGDDLTLPADLPVKVTPKFTTGTGKAVAADLSTSTAKTVTITKGSSSATASFGIEDDALDEPDEALAFKLTADNLPTGVTLGSATEVAATIEDNDAAPTGITLTVSPDTVAENVSTAPAVTVTAQVNGATRYVKAKAVTVAVGASSDTATEGTDYATVSDLSISIAAGAASGTATFTLTPTDDTLHEADETISVSGTATGLTVTPATLTITDDETLPVAALVLTPATITEAGGASTVTATLTGASSEALTLTVAAVAVTPAVADDFTLSTARTLTIAAGATSSSGTVTITASDNDVDAAAKTVTVSAQAGGGHGVAAPAAKELTITDDDSRGVTVAPQSLTVAEVDDATTNDRREHEATYTVVLGSEPTGDVTVAVASGATGVAQAAPARLTFTATDWADAQTVTVSGVADAIDNPGDRRTASVTHTVSGGDYAGQTAASVAVTVNDDDAAPSGITLQVNPTQVAENVQSAPTVTVTAAVNGTTRYADRKRVTVAVGKTSDTATEGTDYATVGALSIAIAAGAASGTASFTLTPTNDVLHEGNEAISVSGTSGALTVTGTTLTITDDDAEPSGITLSVNPTQVTENVPTAPTVTVTAAVNGTTRYVDEKTVAVAVGDSADTATEGTDYATVGALSIAIAAGTASGTTSFTLDPTEDELDEGDEAISVSGTSDVTVTGTQITIGDALELSAPANQVYTKGRKITDLALPAATGGTGAKTYTLVGPSDAAVRTVLPGLSYTANSRTLSGTPSAAKAATTLTYTVTDASGASASASFTVTVVEPPTLADPKDRTYTSGQTVSDALPQASNGAVPLTYTLVGASNAAVGTVLPGLSFTAASRTLGGTAGEATTAAVTLTYRVKDKNGATATQTFTVSISPALTVIPPAPPGGVVTPGDPPDTQVAGPKDQVYTKGIKIKDLVLPAGTGGTGDKSYTLAAPSDEAVDDALPGLEFDADSRTLSGTPTAARTATTLTYTVTDANEVSASITFKVTVVEPPTLADPPDRTYVPTQTVSDVLPAASNGAAPLTYTLVGPEDAAVGTVLPGLGFTAGSRTLGGTAGAEKAAVTLTYTVADKNGASATQTFTVTTAKQVLVLTPTTTTRVYGATEPTAYAYTVAAKAGSTFAPGDSATSTFFTSSPLQRASGEDVGEYAFSLVSSPQYATGMAAKYTFEVKAGAAYTITKKTLSIVTPVVLTKVYDGDADAAGASIKSGGVVSGEVGSESFALTVSGGTYPQSDVGSGLTISSPTFTLSASGGAKTGNYQYTLPDAATGDITAKEVTVASAVLSKEYDGGTGISGAKLSGGEVSGEAGSESLTLKVTGGSYASADVGTNITISDPVFALEAGSGTDKANYRLPSGITLTGTITAKALTIGGSVVLTKVYDGDADATGASIKSGGAVSGEVGAESFALTVSGGTYPQSDVGSGLTISSPTFTLSASGGAKTGNYQYTLPDAATGDITAKEVTVASAVLSKEYDGGTGDQRREAERR